MAILLSALWNTIQEIRIEIEEMPSLQIWTVPVDDKVKFASCKIGRQKSALRGDDPATAFCVSPSSSL